MATAIYGNLSDFDLNTLEALVVLTPNNSLMAYGNNLALGHRIEQYTSNGSCSFATVIPSIYRLDFLGCDPIPFKYINVPETNGTGSLNINTLIIDDCSSIDPSHFNVISASFATLAQTANTASYFSGSSNAVSSSYALTASYAMNGGSGGSGTTLTTGSTYQVTASWSNNTLSSNVSVSSSFASQSISSSYSVTASFALNDKSTTLITGSTYQITSSWANNSVNANSAVSTSWASASVSSSYSQTASFALNAGGGSGTTLTTGSTYQITSSWAKNAVSASYTSTSSLTIVNSSSFASSSISSSYATTSSFLAGSPVMLRNATTNLSIKQLSTLGGGSNAFTDALTSTASFEGQLGVSYFGSKDYFLWPMPSTNPGDVSHSINFPAGIESIGTDPYMKSGSNMLSIAVNGCPAGHGASGDSGVTIFNYSSSSLNSGVSLILAIHSASGVVADGVGCAFAHVPSNRIPQLIPGNAMLVFDGQSTNMKGLAIAAPAMGGFDSGNYSLAYFDLINKLFRIPHWVTASFQPTDLGWSDTLTANPVNANVVIPSGSLSIGGLLYAGASSGSVGQQLTIQDGHINTGAITASADLNIGTLEVALSTANGNSGGTKINFFNNHYFSEANYQLVLADNGATYLKMNSLGIQVNACPLEWTTDGGGDIGANNANRPNNVWIKGNISCSVVTASLFTGTSSFATSASWAPPVASNFSVSSSWASASLSSSYSMTASYAANAGGGSGTTLTTGSTYQITSSWTNNAVSASYAVQTNYVTDNGTAYVQVAGSSILANDSHGETLTLSNGNVALVDKYGDSVTMNGGVTKLVDQSGDSMTLTNGNLNISCPIYITGSISCSVVTASLFTGTSSFATTSSYAVTASWATPPIFKYFTIPNDIEGVNASSTLVAANTVYCWKIDLAGQVTVNNVACYLTTGVSAGYVGISIYSDNGNTRLIDTGPISASVANQGAILAPISPAVTLNPGSYWFAWSGNSTTISTRTMGTAAATLQFLNTGSFPLLGTASTGSIGGQNPATLGPITSNTSANILAAIFKT